jgi:hypothetical protein
MAASPTRSAAQVASGLLEALIICWSFQRQVSCQGSVPRSRWSKSVTRMAILGRLAA